MDTYMFIWSIVGAITYILISIPSYLELELTGFRYDAHNVGIFLFVISEFSLLIYAFRTAERNEIHLEQLVEEKTQKLLKSKTKESETIDKIRREHARELIDGSRRLAGIINNQLDKKLKNALNMIYLTKENPDLQKEYCDSMEESLTEAHETLMNLSKNTGIGELKFTHGDLSEIILRAIDTVVKPNAVLIEYEPEFQAVSFDIYLKCTTF